MLSFYNLKNCDVANQLRTGLFTLILSSKFIIVTVSILFLSEASAMPFSTFSYWSAVFYLVYGFSPRLFGTGGMVTIVGTTLFAVVPLALCSATRETLLTGMSAEAVAPDQTGTALSLQHAAWGFSDIVTPYVGSMVYKAFGTAVLGCYGAGISALSYIPADMVPENYKHKTAAASGAVE